MSVYRNILLAVDLVHDESWNKALPVALGICHQFGARLHVVTAVPDVHMPMIAGYFPQGFMEKMIRDLEHRIVEFVENHVPEEIESAHAIVSGGPIYRLLVDYANQHDIDLVVLEAYRPDVKDYMLGSNAEKVVRHATQSVLVVRE